MGVSVGQCAGVGVSVGREDASRDGAARRGGDVRHPGGAADDPVGVVYWSGVPTPALAAGRSSSLPAREAGKQKGVEASRGAVGNRRV